MLVMPDFFKPSERLLEITNGYKEPFYNLNFDCGAVDMSRFDETIQTLLKNRKIYNYEDYDFVHNGKVVNNLEQCKLFYRKDENGEWQYNRLERLEDGRTINFTLYNKNYGWFDEIKEAHPDLVDMCDKFIKEYNVDTWKILVSRMTTDLSWHMDMDGYYGFRFPLGLHPWKLKFKKVHDDYVDIFNNMSWTGKFTELESLVPTKTYNDEYAIDETSGKAFIFNSVNYVHALENNNPQYFLFIKGTI